VAVATSRLGDAKWNTIGKYATLLVNRVALLPHHRFWQQLEEKSIFLDGFWGVNSISRNGIR